MILTCPSCDTRYEINASALPPGGRTVRCAKCGNSWTEQSEQAAAPAAPVAAPVAAAPPPPPAVPEPPAEPEMPEAPVAQEVGFDEPAPARAPVPPVIDDNFPDPLPQPDDDDDDDDDFEVPSLDDFDDLPNISPRRGKKGKKPKRGSKAGGGGKRIGLMVGWISLLVFFIAFVAGGLFGRDMIVEAWPPSKQLYEAIGMGDPPLSELLDIGGIKPTPGRDKDGKPILTITGNVVNISGEVQMVPQLAGALLDAKRAPVFEWTFKAPKSELKPGEKIEFSTLVPDPPKTAQGLKISFVIEVADDHKAEAAPMDDKKKKDTH
jgi:predicted Zn finger-like uncharacterized protein